MKKSAFFVSLVFVLSLWAGPIESLSPGEWYEVPNSHLNSVAPSGWSANVMAPWSGGAFDSKRDRFIVWGGGHGDYAGNEIYAFDLNTLKWVRVTDPSANTGGVESSGAYPDGLPRSRHTYDYIQYVPNIDRFCTFGGAGLYPSGQVGSSATFCFDFTANQWEKKANAKTTGIANFSGYDPVTGTLWSGKGTLTQWNPLTDVWSKQTVYDNNIEWTNSLTMDVDPGRRKLVAIGAGKVYTWDISNPTASISAVALTTANLPSVVSLQAPGLAFDPVSDKMAAWGGGSDVYTLDLDSKAWTRHVKTGGATPTAAVGQGTYGRFRYSPAKNVFVAVNQIGQNVFIYRLTAGVGTKDEGKGHPSAWLGTGRREGKGEISISPNPARGERVQIHLPQGGENRSLKIYDAKGARVADLSSRMAEGEAQITWNTSSLPAGTYIARYGAGRANYTKVIFILQ